MTEQWRDHPVYTGYQASTHGRIRALGRMVRYGNGTEYFRPGQVKKLSVRQGTNYLGATLRPIGSAKSVQINAHRFICEAFHGLAPADDSVVRHLNGKRQDNRPENLTWGTVSENSYDMEVHGTNYWLNRETCINGHPWSEYGYYQKSRPSTRRCRICTSYEWRRAHSARGSRKTRLDGTLA